MTVRRLLDVTSRASMKRVMARTGDETVHDDESASIASNIPPSRMRTYVRGEDHIRGMQESAAVFRVIGQSLKFSWQISEKAAFSLKISADRRRFSEKNTQI
jgi:hypothetical protein